MRSGKSWLALLLCLVLMAGGARVSAEPAQTQSTGWHNFVVLVDMSGSTDSSKNPTDREGLRFSAVDYLCKVLDSDKTRVGLIFFGGDAYIAGPVEKRYIETSLAPALEDAQEGKLRELVAPRYTDIGKAMDVARDMVASFDPGDDTAVILITDGLNDVNDTPGDYDEDDRSAAQLSMDVAGGFAAQGSHFYVVALTAGGSNQDFLEYANEVGEAGGGTPRPDGSMSNVTEARADTLNDTIQSIYTDVIGIIDNGFRKPLPVEETFEVPYDSLTNVSVMVTCSTQAKQQLMSVSLRDPSGAEYEVWNAEDGCLSSDQFEVSESVNWVGATIKQPAAGTWTIIVPGDVDADVYITAYINMGAGIRPRIIDTGADYALNVPAQFEVALVDEGSVITERRIYDDSTAQLTLTSPSGAVKVLDMSSDGQRFLVDYIPGEAGRWTAVATATNRIMEARRSEVYEFVVSDQAATPAPLSPDQILLEITGTKPLDTGDGTVYLDETAEVYQLSWSIPVDTESVMLTCLKEGSSVPVELPYTGNSAQISATNFSRTEYCDLTIEAVPRHGSEPVARSLRVKQYPEPDSLDGLKLTVNGAPVVDGGSAEIITDAARLSATCETGGIEALRFSADGQNWTDDADIPIPEGETAQVWVMAIPRFGTDADARILSASVTHRIVTASEKFMRLLPYIGIALALLLAAVVALLVLSAKKREKSRMHGTLRLTLNDSRMKTINFGKSRGTLVMQGRKLGDYRQLNDWAAEEDNAYLRDICEAAVSEVMTDSEGTINGEGEYLPKHCGVRLSVNNTVYYIVDKGDEVEIDLFTADGDIATVCMTYQYHA